MDRQTKEIIRENEERFDTFIKLPAIIAVITGILFFFLGIIIAAAGSGYDEEGSAGAMLMWWIIGAILTALNYYISKIALSPMILKVLYLREICENSKVKDSETVEKKEEIKE